ncbi:MAG TPA: tRNA (guanosine(37)-N1)-methyltransferase TrmD [Caldisericia bacterium]|nr:tRNA (guanosine(37)-N1)-methyltransferase TrmD [Caldisericia bacterium]
MVKKFHYLTTFPEIIEAYFDYSIPGRAVKSGSLAYNIVSLRDFTTDKHKTTDDTPYGGGPGMVMKLAPILSAIDALLLPKNSAIILLTPKGRLLEQNLLEELSLIDQLVFLCGHYEGMDERIGLYAHYAISIGDYVIGGGEISSLVLSDGIIRLHKDVLGNADSALQDSFSQGLLDYPQYTKPRIIDEFEVPEVLCSGHHKNIAQYRRKESLKWTLLLRPELLKKTFLSKEDKNLLKEIKKDLLSAITENLNE